MVLESILGINIKHDKPFFLIKNILNNVPSMDQIKNFKTKAERSNTIRSDVPDLYVIHAQDISEFNDFGDFKILSKTIKTVFSDKNEYENVGAGLLISETTRDKSAISGLPSHSDQTNQIHWACHGEAEWKISWNNSIKTYIVGPGDVFFLSKGTVHSVESITPRASIIISVGKELEGYEKERNY